MEKINISIFLIDDLECWAARGKGQPSANENEKKKISFPAYAVKRPRSAQCQGWDYSDYSNSN